LLQSVIQAYSVHAVFLEKECRQALLEEEEGKKSEQAEEAQKAEQLKEQEKLEESQLLEQDAPR